MRIVPIGLVLIPLGALFFLMGRRALLWATIASIPFFLVIVVELPFAPVRAFQFFGGLLMVRRVMDCCIQGRLVVWKSGTLLAALLFLLAVVGSLFAPALMSETIYVVPEGESSVAEAYQNMVPAKFRVSNITQLAYPVFGVALFYTIFASLKTYEQVVRAIHLLKRGFVVLVVFSVVYIGLDLVGGQAIMDALFPLFSDKPNAAYQAYNALGGLVRPYTPAGEPGYTGVYFLIILSILFGLRYSGYQGRYRPTSETAFLITASVATLVNASTTAYFGVVSMFSAFIFVVFLRRDRDMTVNRSGALLVRSAVGLSGVLVASFIVMQYFGISLVGYIAENHLAKITQEAGSGAIRLYAFQYTITEVFLERPIFGVGYGSHRALSLSVYLLANIGIVGTLSFLFLNGMVFWHGVRTMNRDQDPRRASIAFALNVAHLAVLATLFVAKSETSFSFGWLWLLLALSEANYRLYRRSMPALASAPAKPTP